MAIKLYGHAGALCTKRVIVTLAELNLPYELVKIDILQGEQKQPDYLAKHPFGKIPYLEDGEGDEVVRVAESRAICRYLVAKYAGSDTALMPSRGDLRAFAQFEQVSSWC
jgi:glutathione S-transferase